MDILWLAMLLLVMWLWWEGLRSKERARKAGLQACERAGVQFLDDTVERENISLRRGVGGRIQLRRVFRFEFASDGEKRYRGRIVMIGPHVFGIEMDVYRI